MQDLDTLLKQEPENFTTEQISKLQKSIIEYQYKTGERKRPLERTTITDYLENIGKYKGENIIVTGAVLQPFEKKGIFPKRFETPLLDLETLQRSDFRVPIRNRRHESLTKELLDKKMAMQEQEFIVISYKKTMLGPNTYYKFISGVVEQGQEIIFDSYQ